MVKANQKTGVWTLGFALFSMFFGSGNLIFPIEVGTVVQGHCAIGTLGFILTAVLLPLLGAMMMIAYKGDYLRFFSIFSRPVAIVLIALILISWVPLGSGPRCVTVAYGAITQSLEQAHILPLWLFSLLYCTAVMFVSRRTNAIIKFLGTYLTPILLICLSMIFIMCYLNGPTISEPCNLPSQAFVYSLLQGYYTQDLISSFFFSSTIIGLLYAYNNQPGAHHTSKDILKLSFYGSLIGVFFLGLVYTGLLYLGAAYTDTLRTVPPEQRLPLIGFLLIGSKAGFITVTAITLACFSTSIALLLVFANFFKETICRNKISDNMAALITSVLTWCMSILGFSGIAFIVAPIMEFIYPVIFILIIANIIKIIWKKSLQE